MKLHNTYTVKIAGNTVTAFNSVTENFWANMKKYPHWANFIALTAEDGTSVYAPALTEFTNCDPSRGDGMFVRYTASVDCLNKRYVSVSLCADKTATGVMSKAPLDLISAGDTAEIAAVIYLETLDSDYVTFCAGDNPLIRRILGCGEDFPVRMGWGTFDYPSVVCERTTDLIEEFFDTEFTFTDNGMSAKVDEPMYGVELVLFSGDTPLMRAVRPYDMDVRFGAMTADSHLAIKLGKEVESISNITVNGKRQIKVDSCGIVDSIVPASSEPILNLGADGSVKTDPDGEYVLFISTAFSEVYKIEEDGLRLMLRLSETADFWEMCRGGAVFMGIGNTAKIYEPDANGNYTSFTATLETKPVYPKCVAVREGDRYHFAYLYDINFTRYEITRTYAKVLSYETAGEPMSYISRCGDAIAMGAKYLFVKTLDVDYSSEYTPVTLYNDLYSRAYRGTGDGFVYFDVGGTSFLYDIVHNLRLSLGGKMYANGRIIYGAGKFYIYDHYNGLREIDPGFDMTEVTSMCIAGNDLFVLKGTKLYLYKCNCEYTSVRLPVSALNTTVTYNVRQRVYKGDGKGAVLKVDGE